ncbi:MAG: ATPase, partial [Candidatus Altiarchaeales archaeon]
MKREEIITVLAEWNFWGRGLETGIKRDYAKKFLEYLEGVNKILSAYGVRRAGKSFVLRDVAKTLSESYGDRNILYVNFEETKFDETLDRKFLWKIYEAFLEIIKPESKPFILLDEVQEIEGWEKVVRTLHERDEARIIVTGSSAKLMSEELSTLLSGRGIKMEIFPLNFLEFMEFRGFRIEDKSEILINYREIMAYLR